MKFDREREFVRELLRHVKDRFGIEEWVFDGFKFLKRGEDVWIMSIDSPEQISGINRIGLRFARGFPKNIKITTAVIQIFGKYANKNVVYINDENLRDFLKGKDIEIGEILGVDKGQVIVKFGEDVIGSALYDGRTLKNQIPKARRIN